VASCPVYARWRPFLRPIDNDPALYYASYVGGKGAKL
jgi:hypothetical protein